MRIFVLGALALGAVADRAPFLVDLLAGRGLLLAGPHPVKWQQHGQCREESKTEDGETISLHGQARGREGNKSLSGRRVVVKEFTRKMSRPIRQRLVRTGV